MARCAIVLKGRADSFRESRQWDCALGNIGFMNMFMFPKILFSIDSSSTYLCASLALLFFLLRPWNLDHRIRTGRISGAFKTRLLLLSVVFSFQNPYCLHEIAVMGLSLEMSAATQKSQRTACFYIQQLKSRCYLWRFSRTHHGFLVLLLNVCFYLAWMLI